MSDTNPLRNNNYLLGKRIQHLRIKRGMTQERLAEEVGISRVYLASIETGKKAPALKHVYKIAQVLDIKKEEFFRF